MVTPTNSPERTPPEESLEFEFFPFPSYSFTLQDSQNLEFPFPSYSLVPPDDNRIIDEIFA